MKKKVLSISVIVLFISAALFIDEMITLALEISISNKIKTKITVDNIDTSFKFLSFQPKEVYIKGVKIANPENKNFSEKPSIAVNDIAVIWDENSSKKIINIKEAVVDGIAIRFEYANNKLNLHEIYNNLNEKIKNNIQNRNNIDTENNSKIIIQNLTLTNNKAIVSNNRFEKTIPIPDVNISFGLKQNGISIKRAPARLAEKIYNTFLKVAKKNGIKTLHTNNINEKIDDISRNIKNTKKALKNLGF